MTSASRNRARATIALALALLCACSLPPSSPLVDGTPPASDLGADRARDRSPDQAIWLDGNGPILVRAVSYNLKGFDWSDGTLPRYPAASSTDDINTTLGAHAPDVVGLQESRRIVGGAAQSEEIARALGGLHEFSLSTTTSELIPYQQQNAIVSRYPLLERTNLDLGPDGAEHRRFLYARAQLPGGRVLHLGNVHVFTKSELQLPAVKAIEGFLQGKVKEGDFFLMTGDFNFAPSTAAESPYLYLTQKFTPRLVDPAVALGMAATDPALYTINPSKPVKRIDFVFISGALIPRAYQTIKSPLPNLTYPDHLPAMADVEVPGR